MWTDKFEKMVIKIIDLPSLNNFILPFNELREFFQLLIVNIVVIMSWNLLEPTVITQCVFDALF